MIDYINHLQHLRITKINWRSINQFCIIATSKLRVVLTSDGIDRFSFQWVCVVDFLFQVLVIVLVSVVKFISLVMFNDCLNFELCVKLIYKVNFNYFNFGI